MKHLIALLAAGTIGYCMGFQDMKYRLMKSIIESLPCKCEKDEDESK